MAKSLCTDSGHNTAALDIAAIRIDQVHALTSLSLLEAMAKSLPICRCRDRL
ncbi:hypothetical protein LMG28727_00282 [Paraburkholderia kirstenboschensis]|uniref:hypothetical protein n=1 Tax=Paraburkholderia kirstenboschensis TaxID=1245436 RepID=UPI000B12A28E|nr:hypothetical protein [Paraburkholderia kirstenboschensis]CAD6509867.1 hypothetical protein LMG28727_00282 [Paraburkholderia kirstenboschensis]